MRDLRPFLAACARDAKRYGDGEIRSMMPMLTAEYDTPAGGAFAVVGFHETFTPDEVAEVARIVGSHWFCRAVSFTCDALVSGDLDVDLTEDFTQNPGSEVRRSVLVTRQCRDGATETLEMAYRYDDRACVEWVDQPGWCNREVVTPEAVGVFDACRRVFDAPVDSLDEAQVIARITQRGHSLGVAS